jgi:predicted CXXCH cytochrome family protein
MNFRSRLTRNSVIFGGTATWGLLLISCVAVNRTMLAPPFVPGAEFVGTKSCAECHADITDKFGTATHSRLALSSGKAGDTGCEACHGAGSIHAKADGARGTIVNPRQSPETCFQCHLDKRGELSLPHSHAVLAGKVGCGDCHDPHSGNAIKGGALNLATANETCTTCHTAQKGPFVFKHNATLEGCTACHNPHGSVNQKMLVARDDNLCLRCHLEVAGTGQIIVGGEDHASRLQRGTCWSAGCHEAVHGSNANKSLRF